MLSKDRFDLVLTIFDDFREKILNQDSVDYGNRPNFCFILTLISGLIHSDINETNVLIDEKDGHLGV